MKPINTKMLDLVPAIKEKWGRSRFDDDYPHITKNLGVFWGSEFFNPYVESLVMVTPTENRNSRIGFPFEVLQELRMIVEYHGEKFPKYKMSINIWA